MPQYEFDVHIRYSTSITVFAEDEDEAVGKAVGCFNDTKFVIDENERSYCEIMGVKRID